MPVGKIRTAFSSIFSLSVAVWSLEAWPATPHQLEISVTGLKNTTGQVGLLLFSSKSGFPEDTDRAASRRVLKIQGSSVKAIIDTLPPGTYAVSVIHDENGNGKLDRNFLGIPSEGYGFSNNIRHSLRAPTFEEAAFEISKKSKAISVRIGY